jgi:hypothetical protein
MQIVGPYLATTPFWTTACSGTGRRLTSFRKWLFGKMAKYWSSVGIRIAQIRHNRLRSKLLRPMTREVRDGRLSARLPSIHGRIL